jgi:hypothetical protein
MRSPILSLPSRNMEANAIREMSDHIVFKAEIKWRVDIAAAPKKEPILMIAAAIPSHVGNLPEMVVAHWYEGNECWVVANVWGENRRGVRLELKPICWAELCDLPAGVDVRFPLAGSTGRRNTGVKSLCWGFKLQGLTWPFVELTSHFVQIGLRVHR